MDTCDTMPADMPGLATGSSLTLPPEITIYTVGELHPLWLAWLAQLGDASAQGRDTVELHAQAVDQVDAAGMQLLAALERTLCERGVKVRRCGTSTALLQAGRALGLDPWQDMPVVPAGEAA